MLDTITFLLEMLGTIAFAVSGALVGIEKKMDVLGVAVLGVTTAVGGGVIRDVTLGNTPPQAFINPFYAILAIVVSLVIFFPKIRRHIQDKQRIYDKLLLIMDSLGLGIFTVLGIAAAKNSYNNLFLLIFVGVITGVGGGAMRDIMSGNMPFIFHKHFYCSASIIGALLTALLWDIVGSSFSMFIGTAVIFILRLLAARYKWELPKA